MLYEKHDGMPAPGSHLESVFHAVWTKRQEQHVTKSWLDILTHIPAELSDKRLDAIKDARRSYIRSLFPYFEEAEKKDAEEPSEIHKALEEFSKLKIGLNLKSIMRAQIEQRKAGRRLHGMPRVRKS